MEIAADLENSLSSIETFQSPDAAAASSTKHSKSNLCSSIASHLTKSTKISGVGPFGRETGRSLQRADSLVHDHFKRMSTCENWRISEPNGKSNMRLRLIGNFYADPNGPGPGQYQISHDHDSTIENVPKAVLSFRPKNVSATKLDVPNISGKLIYDLEKSNKKSNNGPKIGGTPSSSTPAGSKLLNAVSHQFFPLLLCYPDDKAFRKSRSYPIRENVGSPRKTINMSTLHVKESYAGAIEKLVGNPCPVHESRPGPLEYYPDISAVRETPRSVTIAGRHPDKSSNPHRQAMNGHHLPGPCTYHFNANAFGQEWITSSTKNLKPRPISSDSNLFHNGRTNTVPKLPSNYKSDYAFPKKSSSSFVERGGVMKSTVQNIAQHYQSSGSIRV